MEPTRTPGRLSSAALVARARELGILVEAVTRPPALVVVEGEAGIGKSRLVAEALEPLRAKGFRERIGRNHNQRDPAPLLSVVEALRDVGPVLPRELNPVTGALRVLLPELADRLPSAPEPLGDPAAERHQVMRALRALLAVVGPTVLVLEDMHWADDQTAEFLRYLVADPPGTLSVVLTYRSDEVPDGAALRGLGARVPAGMAHARIVLAPLEPAGVGALAEGILGGATVSEEFACWLHECTEGVPFAVEEVLALLRERQELVHRDGTWHRVALEQLVVPDAIRDAVVERVGNLSAGARRLVLAAAVLARPVDDRLLGHVAGFGDDDHVDALSEAERSGLLHEPSAGRVELRHALARQAVYDAMSPPDRRRLHLRAGRALATRSETAAADLARHFREAGEVEEWTRHAEAAADEAVALFDEATACRLLEPLLALPDLPTDVRVRLAVKYGGAAMPAGRYEDAALVLRAVLDDPANEDAELWFHLAHAYVACGRDLPAAAAAFERCVELADRPGLLAPALSCLGFPFSQAGDVDSHVRRVEEAVRVAAAGVDPWAAASVLATRASVLRMLGRREAAEAIADLRTRGETVVERRQQLRGMTNLVESSFHLGAYDDADDLLREARMLAADLGYLRYGPDHTYFRVMLDFARGRWDGIEAALDRLEDEPRTSYTTTVAGLVRAAVAMLTTTADEPVDRVVAAAAGIPPAGLLSHRAFAARWSTAGWEASGRPEEVLVVALPVLDAFRAKRLWVWGHYVVPAATTALTRLGRLDEAARLVEDFRSGLVGGVAPGSEVAVTVSDGIVAAARGQSSLAAERFESARDAWLAAGAPYDAALAAERLGLVLAEEGDPRGRLVLRATAQELRKLGAERDLARVRRLLVRAGPGDGPGHPGRRAYGADLSPREREIAAMTAQGRTSREIAAALHLSPRTVDNHLARAMSKQGVSSRRELVVS